MLAAAIVQDVLMIAAELQAQPIPTLVLVDEFSAVTPGRVVRLFGRGGSAGLSLLLGTPSARTNGVSPMTDPWRGRQPKYEGLGFRRPKRFFLRTRCLMGGPSRSASATCRCGPRRRSPSSPRSYSGLRGELVGAGGADGLGYDFGALTLGAQGWVDTSQGRHRRRELLRVLHEPRQPDQPSGSRSMMRSTNVPGSASRRTTKYSSAPIARRNAVRSSSVALR
jgi:hypothetical protein